MQEVSLTWRPSGAVPGDRGLGYVYATVGLMSAGGYVQPDGRLRHLLRRRV